MLGRWVILPSDPASHCIILKIDGFYNIGDGLIFLDFQFLLAQFLGEGNMLAKKSTYLRKLSFSYSMNTFRFFSLMKKLNLKIPCWKHFDHFCGFHLKSFEFPFEPGIGSIGWQFELHFWFAIWVCFIVNGEQQWVTGFHCVCEVL